MKVTRDKDGHYRMIKGSIYQADITGLNVWATNNSFKICKAKSDSAKRNNGIIHNHSEEL